MGGRDYEYFGAVINKEVWELHYDDYDDMYHHIYQDSQIAFKEMNRHADIEGAKLFFHYNTITREIVKELGFNEEIKDDRIIRIVIAEDILLKGPLDDSSLNAFNEIAINKGYNVSLLTEAFQERLDDKLPEITILGEEYEINLKDNLLFNKLKESSFDLSKFTLRDDGQKPKLGCFFDRETNTIIDTPPSFGNNIFQITIPVKEELDPVGAAKALNKPSHYFLGEYLLKHHHLAQVEPLKLAKSLDLIDKVRKSTVKKNRRTLK